jgi:two-component system sensor histidine kinase UhpB
MAKKSNTILVVDDTDAQRYATCRVLQHAGYSVMEASTGAAALRHAADRPDLIVLDVKLPDISGFEVVRHLKAHPITRDIPVLHLSATLVTTSAKVAGLESGADGYLVQPVDDDELLASVRALLRIRQAEAALRESELRYRLLFEASPLPTWVFDAETLRFLAVNRAALEQYGYSEEEFLLMSAPDLRPLAKQQEFRAMYANPSVRELGSAVTEHKRKDGSTFDVEIVWRPVEIANGPAWLVMGQDLTQRRKAEAAAREQEVRRQLLERTIVAQEEERRRIARELHDEAGQLVASLLVGLKTIETSRSSNAEIRELVQGLRQITTQAINEIGRIARGLHPTVLDDLGFDIATERYLADYARTHKIAARLDLGNLKANVLPPAVKMGLYRIIQEALTNVARHSNASEVDVRFRAPDHKLVLTIRDNGKGFDPEAVATDSGKHLGMQSMRERANMLGGQVIFRSHPGDGTTVIVDIPVEVRDGAPASVGA